MAQNGHHSALITIATVRRHRVTMANNQLFPNPDGDNPSPVSA